MVDCGLRPEHYRNETDWRLPGGKELRGNLLQCMLGACATLRFATCVPRTIHLLSAFTGFRCSVMVLADDSRSYHSQLSGALRLFLRKPKSTPTDGGWPHWKNQPKPSISKVRQPIKQIPKTKKTLSCSYILFPEHS